MTTVNKILLVFLLSVSSVIHSSVAFKQAKDVHREVQNISGVHVLLKLDPSMEINAYATPYAVYITQGMLNFINTRAQLMSLLGHEVSHFNNKDPVKHQSGREEESRSDKEGYYYCRKGGSTKHQCISLFKKMLKKIGNIEDEEHPSIKERIRRLNNV